MSSYAVNRVMREVNMVPASLSAYRADPAAFLAEYQRSSPVAAELSPAEHDALATKDFGRLYALGAHPYLLWSFTEAVYVPPMPRGELVEAFRRAAEPVGYPDWATTPFDQPTDV